MIEAGYVFKTVPLDEKTNSFKTLALCSHLSIIINIYAKSYEYIINSECGNNCSFLLIKKNT